jgi:hypothetical protein
MCIEIINKTLGSRHVSHFTLSFLLYWRDFLIPPEGGTTNVRNFRAERQIIAVIEQAV